VPTSTGWPFSWRSGDVVDDRVELASLGLVDEVVLVFADHRRLVGIDDDVELVDLHELVGLGHRRAGHAGELVVHAEVVLERDRGERLVLLLDRARPPWPRPPGAALDQRRPGRMRPVNSSTIFTSPSMTT
jgi:hypothetical protein